MQVKLNNEALRNESFKKSVPVLEGINSQIKVLRSMMLHIDDKSTRTPANRLSEMKSIIVSGSIYPTQNLEHGSLFFCSR